MIPFNGAWNRIQQLTGLTTQVELAEALGINPASVSGAKKRGFFPLEWMLKIALDCNVSMDALIGMGTPARVPGHIAGVPNQRILAESPSTARTSHYSPFTSAKEGHGCNADVMAYSEQLLLDEISFNPEHMMIVRIYCDSMTPTLKKGDVVVVDCNQRQLYADGIYAFQVGNHCIVRRVELLLNGAIRVFCDNTIYPSREMSSDQVDAQSLMGLVVWSGGRL